MLNGENLDALVFLKSLVDRNMLKQLPPMRCLGIPGLQ